MGFFIDMTGQRFGRLVALSSEKRVGDTRAYWRCQCDCGNTSVVSGKYLRSGVSRSCGCLMAERASKWMKSEAFAMERVKGNTSHGHKKRNQTSPEYSTWLAIKARCTNEKHKDYPKWGGRGIRVSPEWAHSFEQFLQDMGPRPTLKHQIDREDSNDDYRKGNCRWVTPFVQRSENRRDLQEVTVNGVLFKSLSAAGRHFGVSKTTISYRMKAGYSAEDAVSIPTRALHLNRPRVE